LLSATVRSDPRAVALVEVERRSNVVEHVDQGVGLVPGQVQAGQLAHVLGGGGLGSALTVASPSGRPLPYGLGDGLAAVVGLFPQVRSVAVGELEAGGDRRLGAAVGRCCCRSSVANDQPMSPSAALPKNLLPTR
jgi:hypothetical protein